MNIINIIQIIIYIMLIIIAIIDMREKIISDGLLVAIIILALVIFENRISFLLGIGLFQLPLIFIYSLEEYMNKDLIGFGDVKLVGVIGGLIGGEINISNIEILFYDMINFYKNLYIISGLFILVMLLIKKDIKNKYLPFAPFLIMGYFLGEFFL